MSIINEWRESELINEISGRLLSGMDDACQFAVQQARERAPIGATGKVRRLIDYEVKGVGNDVVGYLGVNKGKHGGARSNQGEAFYWYFHEVGTSKLPARPFLRPAVFENAAEILRRLTGG